MIPIKEAIRVIEDLTDPETSQIIGMCLNSTFFSFMGELYEQACGVAMGSPPSPIIANIFMENFEQTTFNTANPKHEWWSRFVDDTFLIWAHGKEELNKFVDHLNSQNDSIKFTKEFEENNELPFLDTLVIRKHDGGIAHKVYRKKTHTEQFLHALSHHHPS